MRHESMLLIGCAAVLGGILAPAAARCQEDEAAKPRIALRSVYLAERIGRAAQITIRGELGGAAQCTLDGNTCALSLFGDTDICTEIAFPPIDVRLVQLRVADPTGAGRRLFRIEGELPPRGAKYYLVVPRRRSAPHRLVVELGQDDRRVVTLEPLPEPTGKPELCKDAKYRAEQRAGKVRILARGEHPTAGWRVAFEQLPIRIFPPQFRLVCVRPSGIVAQVVTPFEASTSFAADQPIKEVIVHDAAGQHKVPVQQP